MPRGVLVLVSTRNAGDAERPRTGDMLRMGEAERFEMVPRASGSFFSSFTTEMYGEGTEPEECMVDEVVTVVPVGAETIILRGLFSRFDTGLELPPTLLLLGDVMLLANHLFKAATTASRSG